MHADLKEILDYFKDLELTKDQMREMHRRVKGTIPFYLFEYSNASNLDKDRAEFLQWISKIRYTDHHQTNFWDVLPGTGQWLLDDPLFFEWMRSGSILWLHGIRKYTLVIRYTGL
jgi:hypothetical protein